MANGTFYADAVNGNDANDGLSEATAKQTISALLGLGTGGGNKYYVQATGNYTFTSTLTISNSGDFTNGPNVLEGYTTTPGARDGRPNIVSSGISLFQFAGGTMLFDCVHIKFSPAGGIGFLPGSFATTYPRWFDCVFDGCLAAIYGDYGSYWYFVGSAFYGCEFKNGTYGIVNESSINLYDCWIHDNASSGIVVGNGGQSGGNWHLHRCVITDNLGVGFFHTTKSDRSFEFYDCIIANNGSHGISITNIAAASSSFLNLRDNIIYGNGGYGVSTPGIYLFGAFQRNYYGNNTSGARSGFSAAWDDGTLSADPFVDSANGDYNINEAAGGGTVLRAVQRPIGTTTLYPFGAWSDPPAGGGGGGTVVKRGAKNIFIGGGLINA